MEDGFDEWELKTKVVPLDTSSESKPEHISKSKMFFVISYQAAHMLDVKAWLDIVRGRP